MFEQSSDSIVTFASFALGVIASFITVAQFLKSLFFRRNARTSIEVSIHEVSDIIAKLASIDNPSNQISRTLDESIRSLSLLLQRYSFIVKYQSIIPLLVSGILLFVLTLAVDQFYRAADLPVLPQIADLLLMVSAIFLCAAFITFAANTLADRTAALSLRSVSLVAIAVLGSIATVSIATAIQDCFHIYLILNHAFIE